MCDYCKNENNFEVQYAIGRTGVICRECAIEKGYVWIADPLNIVEYGRFYPKDWCGRTKGKINKCPTTNYCGEVKECE